MVPPEDTWPWSHTLSNAAFTAGARWAIRTSSDLSPHIAKFIEMMILLGLIESDEVFFPSARDIPIEYHEETIEVDLRHMLASPGEDSGALDDVPF
jgi:hypothetical protein